ncbi:MAG: glycosyltransferase family 9 protein [Fimbriimonadales bacterium]
MQERPIQRLVVIRNDDKLGETLLATPVLRALREALPDAYTEAWFGRRWTQVVDGSPYVNRVRGVPFRPRGLDFWRGVAALRRIQADACLILRPDTYGYAWIAQLAGVPIRAGVIERRTFSKKVLTHIATFDSNSHQVERNLAVAEAAMGHTLSRPSLAFTPASPATLAPSVAEQLTSAYAVLHLGTGGVQPRWLPERFARVADYLAQRHRLLPVLTGAPDDEVLSARCVQAMRSRAVNLVGQLSVLELAAVLKNASLLVSVDTGVVHLAAALQTPCVSLYFRRDYPAHQWYPWQVPYVAVSASRYCPGCSTTRCLLKRSECVDSVSVESVCEAVDQLMREIPSAIPPVEGV